MNFIVVVSVALLAYLTVVSSDRTQPNVQPTFDLRRIQLRRQGDASDQNLYVVSQLAQSRALRPHRRNFSQRFGFPTQKESKLRPAPFMPSPQDPLPKLRGSFEGLAPYRPRPELRPQNYPSFATDVSRFSEQAQEESRNHEPEDLLIVDVSKRTNPVAFKEDEILFRTNAEKELERPQYQNENKEVLARESSRERYLSSERRRPLFPKQIIKSRIPQPSTSQERQSNEKVVFPSEDEREILKSSETYDFPKTEAKQVTPEQYQEVHKQEPGFSFIRNPEPSRHFREEPPTKVPKRKKVITDELTKEKREILGAETIIDPNGVQFAHDVHKAEAVTAPKDGRISFQLHGLRGPHSYKFGFDTGKGHNRQFRYEERDNYGEVKGRYGYYDNHGKLHIVNYSAHPKHGFAADVPKY